MYATFIGPDFVAVVDSNDPTRWANWGDAESLPYAESWVEGLNNGTRPRSGLSWTRISDHPYRADLSPVTEDRTATGRALAALRRREVDLSREVATLREEAERLRTAQIKGSDPRLREFWEEAQEAATRADYCEVFDRLADELGGPTRYVEVEVTVNILHTFTARMSRSEYADGDFSNLDPSDYIDRYSIDLSNAEIEEVTEV